MPFSSGAKIREAAADRLGIALDGPPEVRVRARARARVRVRVRARARARVRVRVRVG